MPTVQSPLQKAIYGKLTGDATLMALITGVFDHVTQDKAFPYVVIGDDTSIDASTFGRLGEEITVTIHVWSRARGRKETKDIQSRIDTVLNRTTLTIDGFTHYGTVREFQETMQDPDGITYHGVQRFRAYAHE